MEHQKFISLIEGICIIILLIGVWIMFFHSSAIQKEISENCGWGEEDYECYCQKDIALALKNELEGNLGLEIKDVELHN